MTLEEAVLVARAIAECYDPPIIRGIYESLEAAFPGLRMTYGPNFIDGASDAIQVTLDGDSGVYDMNPNFITMIPQVLNLTATLVQLSGVTGPVPKVLSVLSSIAAQGEAALPVLNDLHAEVVGMVQGKSEFSDADWIALQARADGVADKVANYDFAGE